MMLPQVIQYTYKQNVIDTSLHHSQCKYTDMHPPQIDEPILADF